MATKLAERTEELQAGRVRWATRDDWDLVRHLCDQWYGELPPGRMPPIDFNHLGVLFEHGVDNPNSAIWLLHGEEGLLYGFLCQWVWSPEIVATEELWYVLPEVRGKGIAMNLVEEFEMWARANGAAEIAFGIASGIKNAEAAARLMKRWGYEYMGPNMSKRIV